MLEDEIPVVTVTFTTQEVLLFRNALTGEIAVGAEDRVEQCMYGAVVTRVENELDNPTTGGWKIIEVCWNVAPFILCDGTDEVSGSLSRWYGGRAGHIYRHPFTASVGHNLIPYISLSIAIPCVIYKSCVLREFGFTPLPFPQES